MKKLFSCLALLFFQSLCLASTDPFQIVNRTSDLDPNDPNQNAVLTALNSAADQIENTINTTFLSDASQQTFVSAMAEANASNSNALIVDRASNPQKFSVGILAQGNTYSLNSGAFETNNSFPSAGAAGQASLSIGVNASKLGISKIGFIDGKKLMLYINGSRFSYSMDKATVGLTNFGFNAQYKIIEKKGNHFFGWGGLDASLGVNYGNNSLLYAANIKQSTTTTVNGQTASVNVDMDYSFGIDSWNLNFPLEISSNVNFLYAFSLFAGGGVDFNVGSTALKGSASGPVTASASTQAGGGNLFSANSSLNLENGISGKPSLVTARGFGGLQLNLAVLKVVVEGHALSNKTIGAAAMIRVAL